MQSIQKIITFIAKTFLVGSIGFGGYLLGQHTAHQDTDQLADLLVQESQTVSPFEYQVVKLAEALDGEARGHVDDWPHIVAGVFNRTDDNRWADTLTGVLLDGEIDALFDAHPEDLTTEVGQEALIFAAAALAAYEDGDIELAHTGHSWATPVAADGHAYFEGLCLVAEASGHQYFGDCPMRPMQRPADLMFEQSVMAALEVALNE